MKQEIKKLISKVEEILISTNYSPKTIYQYRNTWEKLLKFASQQGIEHMSSSLAEQFLEQEYGIDPISGSSKLPKWKTKAAKRHIYTLVEFQLNGSVLRKKKSKQIVIPESFKAPVDNFIKQCEYRYNSNGTIKYKLYAISQLISHLEQLGVCSMEDIRLEHITSFLQHKVGLSQRTIAGIITELKQFLRFLYEEGYITIDISSLLPMPNHGRGGRLPMIWSEEDVNMLLNTIDRTNGVGKRNYAILLLVSKLGLRDSDVQNLSFDNIDWNTGIIHIIQTKTGNPLELPMSEEIGNAIIEYLKYGRPKQDTSQYVFVRHIAPYGKCGNYYHIMKSTLKKSNIKFDPLKHHGLHTLRHTLATRLLENHIPLQTIADILGHMSVNSTNEYTKVDIEGLRQCAINPQEVFAND